MDCSGIAVESSKGEWGPGQQEINLLYCDALEMADRCVLYKHGVKEIAAQQGKAVTFMAKVAENSAGSSFHIHLSLRHINGNQSAFFDAAAKLGMSQTFQQFLGGTLANAEAATLFWAPTINSYKRFRAGTFAPTRLAWSVDNRSTAFRVLGDKQSLRMECRVPGADANPYLAFSVLLAAGIDGIARGLQLGPAISGNGYSTTDIRTIPKSMSLATERLASSEIMRQAFGGLVVDHYVHAAHWEMEQFETAVTDWELLRLFERC
jgi:glutamine synthetase